LSFAADTKKELTLISEASSSQKNELAAVFAASGQWLTVDGRALFVVETENVATARRIYTQVKTQFGLSAEVAVRRKMRLKKNNVYGIRLTEGQTEVVLPHLGWDFATVEEPHKSGTILPFHEPPFTDVESVRAYLRGAFLAAGSVNAPGSPSYHLEVHVPTQAHADYIQEKMNQYELNAKQFRRKKGFIVYLKEGEKIVDFLSIIGAHQALLKFEDRRILKGMRNQVNRLVNCETANMNKTINAAVRQLETIQRLQATVGLETLPAHLREVAEVRLRFPEANLQELCERLDHRVSKSGLNHRFRKLEEMVAERSLHR
jgi:DNA-binding protein WhiA